MKQAPRIRNATMADCGGIRAVHFGTPGPWASKDECPPWIAKRLQRGYYVQIAELNGEVVGHAEWVENHDSNGNFFYLCVMQIKETFQGQGIGRMMVADGLRVAKSLGCEKVVTIPEEETGSEKFYAKCGFSNGRQIKSTTLPTQNNGNAQNYTERPAAPFEIIRSHPFLFGLSQACPRHMWEITNEKPTGDHRATATFLSDAGDYIQLCSTYHDPQKASVLCWSRCPSPRLVGDILTLAAAKGLREVAFDFFAEYEGYFNEFSPKIISYAVETYRII